MSLLIVQFGLTNAVMFGPKQDVLQPSEALRRKAILVERGSFRPVTHVNVDMLNCACAQFMQEPAVQGKELMEITMNNLLASGDIDAEDFLSRVDLTGRHRSHRSHLKLSRILSAHFIFPPLYGRNDEVAMGDQQPARGLQQKILRIPTRWHSGGLWSTLPQRGKTLHLSHAALRL